MKFLGAALLVKLVIWLPLAANSMAGIQASPDSITSAELDSIRANQQPSENTSIPTVNAPDTGQSGQVDRMLTVGENQLDWWQAINGHIGDFANWLVVLGAIISGVFWPYQRWRKKQQRDIPNNDELMAISILTEVRKLVSKRQVLELSKFLVAQNEWYRMASIDHISDISKDWRQIYDKANDLSNLTMDLSEREQDQYLREIDDLAKSALRKLKARLRV